MLNRISLMGRMTKDPELRYTQSEKPVTTFTIAVDRDGRDAGTDFINCVAWDKTATFIDSYFGKGSMVVVDGRLQMRNWEDRDGNKRTAAEVVVFSVYFGENKKKEEKTTAFGALADADGDLPF